MPFRETNPIIENVYEVLGVLKDQSTSSKFTEQDCKSIQSDDILAFILKHEKLSYDAQLIKKHLAKIYHYQNFHENPASKEEFILLFVSLFTTVLKSYHPEYRRQLMRCIFNFIVFTVISIDFFAASIYFYQTLTIFSIICSIGLISAFLLSLHRYQRINDFFDGIASNLATQFQEQIALYLSPHPYQRIDGFFASTQFKKQNGFSPINNNLPTTPTKDGTETESSTRSNSPTNSEGGRTDEESNGSYSPPHDHIKRKRSYSEGQVLQRQPLSEEDLKQLLFNQPKDKTISPFPMVENSPEEGNKRFTP